MKNITRTIFFFSFKHYRYIMGHLLILKMWAIHLDPYSLSVNRNKRWEFAAVILCLLVLEPFTSNECGLSCPNMLFCQEEIKVLEQLMLIMKNSDERNLWADLIYLFSQWSLLPRSILNTEEYLSGLCRRLHQPFKVGKMHNATLGNYKHIYLRSTYCVKYVTYTYTHTPQVYLCALIVIVEAMKKIST